MSATGFTVLPGFVGPGVQRALVDDVRSICQEAPLVQPAMPNGPPLSVRVTNAGPRGWWSDKPDGYRYVDVHPGTGRPWPKAPPLILKVAHTALQSAGVRKCDFDCAAINWYGPDAKLGMHVDRSEKDVRQPIVSISLGDDAEFLMGGPKRSDPVTSHLLASGDVCVMASPCRGWFHSVKRVLPSMLSPLPRRGRINITVRKVT